jgi:hypothetical protein
MSKGKFDSQQLGDFIEGREETQEQQTQKPPAEQETDNQETQASTEGEQDSQLSEADALKERVARLEAEKEAYTKEMDNKLKAAREDAAKKRKQKQQIKEEADLLFEKEREEYKKELKKLRERTAKLDELEKSREDTEKSSDEKLKLKQIELEAREKEFEKLSKKSKDIETKYNEMIARQEEERKLQDQVYQEKIDELLQAIPESKQKYAKRIAQSEQDKRDALTALLEAKHDGLFDEPSIQVNHSSPKINDDNKNSQEPRSKKELMKQGLKRLNEGITPGKNLL